MADTAQQVFGFFPPGTFPSEALTDIADGIEDEAARYGDVLLRDDEAFIFVEVIRDLIACVTTLENRLALRREQIAPETTSRNVIDLLARIREGQILKVNG